MQLATLVYAIRKSRAFSEVLLGMKKRGLGRGKLNGYGGKFKEGDASIEATAKRELIEESGIEAVVLEERAVLRCEYAGSAQNDQEIHVFLCHGWSGDPQSTEEMEPAWELLHKLPYGKMWPDDIYWLPAVLAGQKLTACVRYDANGRLRHVVLSPMG